MRWSTNCFSMIGTYDLSSLCFDCFTPPSPRAGSDTSAHIVPEDDMEEGLFRRLLWRQQPAGIPKFSVHKKRVKHEGLVSRLEYLLVASLGFRVAATSPPSLWVRPWCKSRLTGESAPSRVAAGTRSFHSSSTFRHVDIFSACVWVDHELPQRSNNRERNASSETSVSGGDAIDRDGWAADSTLLSYLIVFFFLE